MSTEAVSKTFKNYNLPCSELRDENTLITTHQVLVGIMHGYYADALYTPSFRLSSSLTD